MCTEVVSLIIHTCMQPSYMQRCSNCMFVLQLCETIFVYNAVAYAERQRLATMMGMQSTPRLTPVLHWLDSGPGLPLGSALHRKYIP